MGEAFNQKSAFSSRKSDPLQEALKVRRLKSLLRTPEGFQFLYRNDPAKFVRNCILWGPGEGPTPYQEAFLQQMVKSKRGAIRGPHGLGKTALSSWIILWFALTRDGQDWKVVTTAGAWRQLVRFTWPEVHKWARRLRWDVIGRPPMDNRTELLSTSINLKTGNAFAVASDQPALIEGAHASHLLYLFDEAKSIPASTWDAVEGAFASEGECYAVAMSTPGEPSGRFYDIHARRPGYEDWSVHHVSVEDAVRSKRVSAEWVEQRKRQWGERSALYQNRVLGNFASGLGDGIMALTWVEASNARWQEITDAGKEMKITHFGVDVADQGDDDTVIAVRCGKVVKEIRRHHGLDTMETTGIVAGLLKANPGSVAVVDVIGIGAGVVARLREQGLEVEPFNASERTDVTDRSGEMGFLNQRSAGWWCLRELLDPSNSENISLPPDDYLTGDLTAPRSKTSSTGKIQIESKDEIRKRIGRSTDAGDAVMMAFAADAMMADVGVSFI